MPLSRMSAIWSGYFSETFLCLQWIFCPCSAVMSIFIQRKKKLVPVEEKFDTHIIIIIACIPMYNLELHTFYGFFITFYSVCLNKAATPQKNRSQISCQSCAICYYLDQKLIADIAGFNRLELPTLNITRKLHILICHLSRCCHDFLLLLFYLYLAKVNATFCPHVWILLGVCSFLFTSLFYVTVIS